MFHISQAFVRVIQSLAACAAPDLIYNIVIENMNCKCMSPINATVLLHASDPGQHLCCCQVFRPQIASCDVLLTVHVSEAWRQQAICM